MAQQELPEAEQAHAEYVARRNAALKQMFAQREQDIAEGRVELWDDERLFVELAKRRGAYVEVSEPVLTPTASRQ